MNKDEAIKYLQQLHPNGGHCWLDEQRIEAIGMAVKALQEEPISNPIDFEKELYKAFGQVKDFTLGMRIAKRFYDMGKKSREPVSEDLEEAADKYESEQQEKYKDRDNHDFDNYRDGFVDGLTHTYDAFKAGAKWQKEQMITKAIDAHCFGFQGAALFSFRLPADNYLVGSEVKVIVVKERNEL